MTVESKNSIHKEERRQADPTKTTAEQYAEFHNLDYSKCDSTKVEDVSKRGKVKVLDY